MPTKTVPNLIQGVSQQAEQQRRPAQCATQFDCFNSAVDGAAARPEGDLLRLHEGLDLRGAFFSEIIRGEENYAVGVANGKVFAFNLTTGAESHIVGGDLVPYLTAPTGQAPRDVFRSLTVEDTTFLLNRTVAPAIDQTVRSPEAKNEALIFVRSGAISTSYNVFISGKNGAPGGVAQFTTPGGESNSYYHTSKAIAEQLASDINAISGYVAIRSGSTIYVYRPDGGDFEVVTEDGNGDDYMIAIKKRAPSYSKLPARGHPGFATAVQGESRTKDDDFYVRYTGAATTGTWTEVVGPNVPTSLEGNTMPHTLTLTNLDEFTFTSKTWSTRIAGDVVTAKDPSFVGKYPRDIFYDNNRLGILYNGGVVWSKSRNPYTYFPDTVQTVLATAPVDAKLVAGAASRGAAQMDYAVQLDESLFLWASRTQFRVTSQNETFKQDTVDVKPQTAYEYSPTCEPLAIGSYLYFGANIGAFSTLRSVMYQQGRPAGDVTITAHAPKYIPSGIRWLVGSDTLGALFGVSDGDPTRIFCYNYLVQGQEYVQSAWNTWRIPGGEILWLTINGNLLRVFQQRPEGVAILVFDLTAKVVDEGIEGARYRTRLDVRVTQDDVTGLTYNEDDNMSSFSLPYTPAGAELRVIIAESHGVWLRGDVAPVLSTLNRAVTVKGDLTGVKFYVGHRITSERTQSRFYLTDDAGAVIPFDRLTVERFRLEFADTGYTRLEVTNTTTGAERKIEWTGRTAGLSNSVFGPPVVDTAYSEVAVNHLSDEAEIRFVNDSFLPSYWQQATYTYTGVGKAGVR